MSMSIFSRMCRGPEMLEAKEKGRVQIGGGGALRERGTALAALERKSPQMYLTSLRSRGWSSWVSAMARDRARRRR